MMKRMQTRPCSRYFLGCTLFLPLLLALPASGQDALRALIELDAERQTIEADIIELESRYGPYDENLLEPLQALVAIAQSQGDLERATEIQNRRLQITRTVLGFESPALVPLLEEQMQLQIRRRQWQDVSETLEHMHHIQVVNFGQNSEAALESMQRQFGWLLARVRVDSDRDEADNFLDARELSDEMLDLAEERIGEDSPESIPWLYQRAFNLNQLVQILNADNRVAGETLTELVMQDGAARVSTTASRFGSRSVIPVIDLSRGREPIGVGYIRQALGYIDDIRDIAKESGDLEMQAIAEIYHGDYQLLMYRGTGGRRYGEARTLLIESGIDAARIDAFFARPTPIPSTVFVRSFAALEDLQAVHRAPPEQIQEESLFLGEITGWSEQLPNVARPEAISEFVVPANSMSEVLLEFSISSKGSVSSVDTLTAMPDERGVRREARRAIEGIKFRPVFSEDRLRRTRDVLMYYRFDWQD